MPYRCVLARVVHAVSEPCCASGCSPKNGGQFGEHQFVLLKHANAVEWLRSIHGPSDAVTLWPCKKPRFAALFKQMVGELGIKGCGFTPIL